VLNTHGDDALGDRAWRNNVEFVIIRFITTGLRIIVQASF
jgi:hypothetical protein